MKKTVIKRRKRVPAASAQGNATSPSAQMIYPVTSPGLKTAEQQAAEALVTVSWGRPSNPSTTSQGGGEDDDAPRRKRQRRSKKDKDHDSSKLDDHEGMDIEQQRRMDIYHPSAHLRVDDKYLPRFASPSTGGPGVELPPLNPAMLRMDAFGGPDGMRAYSPNPLLSLPMAGSGSPMMHHPHLPPTSSFFPVNGHQPPPRQAYGTRSPDSHMMMSHSLAPPPAQSRSTSTSVSRNSPPHELTHPTTLSDLERHYEDMQRERKRMEELLHRTERVMNSLKRSIDEMRNAPSSAIDMSAAPQTAVSPRPRPGSKAPTPPPVATIATAVPLPRKEKGLGEPVWVTTTKEATTL